MMEVVFGVLLLTIWPIADSIKDKWRDGGAPLKWLAVKYPKWYAGSRTESGLSPYKNNGNPFQSDFWHNVKLVEVYTISGLIGLAMWGFPGLFLIPAIAFYKGVVFTVFYHQVWK
jgi:hypothetical protein